MRKKQENKEEDEDIIIILIIIIITTSVIITVVIINNHHNNPPTPPRGSAPEKPNIAQCTPSVTCGTERLKRFLALRASAANAAAVFLQEVTSPQTLAAPCLTILHYLNAFLT